MTDPVRLGIAGLGTVGTGVVKIVQRQANLLARRCGRPVQITAVSARSRDKDRGVDIKSLRWEDDPVALARRDDVDVVVELMGGSDGPAKAAWRPRSPPASTWSPPTRRCSPITARPLPRRRRQRRVLRFEAAVAGGIPVVKALTEGLAGNEITRVMGVMNGTCNYILTRMDDPPGLTYEEAFEEADKLGYLEADPSSTWAASTRATS
jgi:homoserine dehydrogenase